MSQGPFPTDLVRDVAKRRTFAIISHPDAGKTTLTEKLLLFGGAIQLAGTVKARKSSRHATSDWMEVEKQRGISVTSSVMQFEYAGHTINLLDTPGHQDFSEDTYRVLTAVDAAVMVIDAAKGVEEQTIKLLEVCRLRATPIITFVNKMDREVREPLALLEEIEAVLKIDCAPVTLPIGMGKSFRGVFDLHKDRLVRFTPGEERRSDDSENIVGLDNPRLDELFSAEMPALRHDGDTLTEGEQLSYKGIPYFAPELFRLARPRDPFKAKQLQKGLQELGEEGAIQVFDSGLGTSLLLGAVGPLQFEVVAQRLQSEYKVDAVYDAANIYTARWLTFPDETVRRNFVKECASNMARDVADNPVYLAPNKYNLELAMERWPKVGFHDTREHGQRLVHETSMQ